MKPIVKIVRLGLILLLETLTMVGCAYGQRQSLDEVGQLERTIDLPHAGVEKMVWSDDGTKIAVLLSHGVYVANAQDGHGILDIWGGGDSNEGRLPTGTMLAFTADGSELVAPVWTGGHEQRPRWENYLFSVIDIPSGKARYILASPDHLAPFGAGDGVRDGQFLVTEALQTGYLGVYQAARPDQLDRYLGPILNSYNNSLGTPKLFYDSARSRLVLIYISGEIKVWDTARNISLLSFSPSITGFKTGYIDRSSGNICTGGNGVISGGQDDPRTLVRCWNIGTGKLIKAFSGTTSGVNTLAVSPNGRYIVAIDGGERLPLHLLYWKSDTSEPLAVVDFGRQSARCAAAFSPDGRTLAVAVGNHVSLISIAD